MAQDNSNMQWYIPNSIMKSDSDHGNHLAGNFTQNSSGDAHHFQQIISDEVMKNIDIFINILLCGTLAILGTFNNAITMIIFYQLGLKDSMSVCLFGLALSDFLLSFSVMVSRAFPVWDKFFSTEYVDPMAIWYVACAWAADSLFLCSGWITTYLAIERCMCVTFPFKVKNIFTKTRAIVVVSMIYVVMAAVYCPIYLTHWLEWINVELQTVDNKTDSVRRLVVVFSEDRIKIQYYVDILSITVIPIPSLVIILGSVTWMVYELIASSRIRQSMTASVMENSKLDHKTRRLVKVVLLLAIIFTICSIPRFYATYNGLLNREVSEGGSERNLYTFQWQLSLLGLNVNASANIIVYLIINSSFRMKFQSMFRCCCSSK